MTSIAAHGRTPGWRWRAVVERLQDRLGAGDPAFSRLRLASRAILSLLLSVAALAALSQLHPLPQAAFGLAVVIAFNGSMAVKDKGLDAQVRTRLLALGAAVLSVLLASLLEPLPLIADLGFLVVIFAAVYLRRFGQRWFAVGMIGFMAYFIGDYLRPAVADIGWVALAAAIALAMTQLVTGLILRDDAERDFRRALLTIDRRIELILEQLLVGAPVARPKMQEQLSRLRDNVMMAEGFVPQGEAGSLAARGPASDLAIALFDLQLLVERLARASYLEPPPKRLLTSVLAGVPEPAAADENIAAHLLRTYGKARSKLEAVLGPRPSPAFAAPPPPAAAVRATAGAAGERPLIPLALHAPIQVTLACAIAMTAGHAVSSTRWYWAVITAFIVFNNTKSRGDTAVRALQRSAGTLAGLVGGTLLATVLHGQLVISAIGIPVLFFLAFYYLQVSYSVMIFLITLALALLYGLLGSFSPELLVERLWETLIGSLAGGLVAFFVFPTRASKNAAAALDKYLSALRDVVSAAKGRAFGEPEPLHLLARSRLLDRSYTELALAARPIGSPWAAVTRFGEVRERLLLLTGAAHWARVLARSLPAGVEVRADAQARIADLTAEIAAKLDAAAKVEDAFFERPEAHGERQVRPPLPISEEADPVFALEVISSLLERATPARDTPAGG